MTLSPRLKVDGLTLTYRVRQGEVRAVQDVSFELGPRTVPGPRWRIGLR